MNPEIESMLELTIEHLLNNEEREHPDLEELAAEVAAALREYAEMIEEDIKAGAYAQ